MICFGFGLHVMASVKAGGRKTALVLWRWYLPHLTDIPCQTCIDQEESAGFIHH